jgi:hypothetical protein
VSFAVSMRAFWRDVRGSESAPGFSGFWRGVADSLHLTYLHAIRAGREIRFNQPKGVHEQCFGKWIAFRRFERRCAASADRNRRLALRRAHPARPARQSQALVVVFGLVALFCIDLRSFMAR